MFPNKTSPDKTLWLRLFDTQAVMCHFELLESSRLSAGPVYVPKKWGLGFLKDTILKREISVTILFNAPGIKSHTTFYFGSLLEFTYYFSKKPRTPDL